MSDTWKPHDAQAHDAGVRAREGQGDPMPFPFDLAMPIATELGAVAGSLEAFRYRPIPRQGCCGGTTKKGTRCGRTVVLGNGRCRSHGGENSPEQMAAMFAALQARDTARAKLTRERLALKLRRALRRAKKRNRGLR